MQTFTIFCVELGRTQGSTTHISSHEAETIELAKQAGIEETAEDWACEPDDVVVLGVAAGDVTILEWDDEV